MFLKYVQLLMFDWVKKKINVFQYTIIYNDKNRKSKIWKTLIVNKKSHPTPLQLLIPFAAIMDQILLLFC
jgi:hypothetical protein